MERIYLDNAATSWPKPKAVYEIVDQAMRVWGAPAGRGAYREAELIDDQMKVTRQELARFLNAPAADHVIFTGSCTDSLNLALMGLLRPGDHVVTSVIEHNSILRPLFALEQQGIQVTRVDCDDEGLLNPADIKTALRPETKLIALSHVSNVTGAIQPIAEIGAIARSAGVLFLVDAAQSLGYLPLDFEEMKIDLLAVSGHKGLMGILGTGILVIRPGVEKDLLPFRRGGTGILSDEPEQPEQLPEKYEAGNLGVPGILSMLEGVRYLQSQGMANIRQEINALTEQLLGGIAELPGIRILGPTQSEHRSGVVSLTLEDFDPQEVALGLDSSFRIQTRAGLHCAPEMHRRLGTLASGGALRLSLGHFTTKQEVEQVVSALAQWVGAPTNPPS
ncbi:Aminotransferase class V-fold PLP-dependent enzyme [Planctomycetales bacterium 10988]|nr:Aminotransferase class V-fold PLP-dependent enzyme [Planctomycetales bacterium 10988]